MKWFNFLNKTGKINIGALAISGAVIGGGLVLGSYQHDVAQEEAMRTSMVGATSSEDFGMKRDSKGRLTAMNIGGGHRLDFSSDNGSKFSANEGAAGRLSSGFQGGDYSAGTGAQFGATEGLGMGGNEATIAPAASTALSNGAYKGALNGDAVSAAAAATGKHSADGPRLAAASMAKAPNSGGNGSIAMNGASSGGHVSSSSGGNGHVKMDKAAEPSAYNFSGKMDEGTFLAGNPKAGKSSFGGNRDLTVGKARRPISGEGSEIQQMYNITKQVASDADRNATAGMTAFLNDGYHGVGMGQNTMAEAGGAAVSDDLGDASKNLKPRGFGGLGDEANKEEEEHDKARNTLMWMTLAMVMATMALMWAGYALIKAGKNAEPIGTAMIAGGWVLIGVGIAYSIAVLGVASDYYAKYGKDTMGIVGIVGSIACMSLLALAGALAFTMGGSGKLAKMEGIVKKAVVAGEMSMAKTGLGMAEKAGASDGSDTTSAAKNKTKGSDKKKA